MRLERARTDRKAANSKREQLSGTGGRIVLALGALAIATIAMLLGPGPAGAAVTHRWVENIERAAGSEPLLEPSALAVDRKTGHVFIAEPGNGYVDVYDASGAYVARFGGELLPAGIAVDEASGRVYVADEALNAVLAYKPDEAGTYEFLGEWSGARLSDGEFGQVTGVAVDNSTDATAGDVYVVDAEDPVLGVGAVDLLAPTPTGPGEGLEGELVRVLTKRTLVEPNAAAVNNATGRVYVADSVKGTILEYSSSGAYEGKLNGSTSPLGSFSGREGAEGNISGLALDPASGDLLVAEGEAGVVSEFGSGGEWVGWLTGSTSEMLTDPTGTAIDATGRVYVAQPRVGRVGVFGPAEETAGATTEKSTKVTRSSAVLSGIVVSAGQTGHALFEWGATQELGHQTAPVAFATGSQTETANLTGLTAGATYYYRLSAETATGVSYGATESFATPTAVEGVITGAATGLDPTGATLTGSLTPGGVDARYYFEWGPTSLYGNASPGAPGADAGAGKAAIPVTATLSSLTPNTHYHYRIVAENSFGTTYGADKTLETPGVPAIGRTQVEAVGQEAATLTAEVNPDESAATYRFEYGETTGYGLEAPSGGGTIPAGAGPVAVSAALTGLKLGVVYHYRLIATNGAGTTISSDRTFSTLSAASVSSTATDVTATGATLRASINPLGHDTTYYFEYGIVSCATQPPRCTEQPAAPGMDAGSGTQDVMASVWVTGLVPNTTYHYRVVAVNALGRSESEERSFATQRVALSDGRAWEMVSPPFKGAAPVEALTREGGLILASEDGDKLTYVTDGALGGGAQGNRSPEWQQILATRGTTEWRSQDIATPNDQPQGLEPGEPPEYQFFTPDLSSSLVEPLGNPPTPPLAPGVTQATPYLRDGSSGTYLPIVGENDVAPGTLFGNQLHFLDATNDLTHVVLISTVALGGHASAPGLYEWAAGKLTFVSALPSGAPARGEVEVGYSHTAATALSGDGSRVIWTTPNPEAEAHLGHLYLRDVARAETIQLDAAQGVPQPKGGGVARFQLMNTDGSRVFFTDSQRLTLGSSAEPASPSRSDLYECDVVVEAGKLHCRLSDLTADRYPGEPAAVQGAILGASGSADALYLVAQGVLADNSTASGESAKAGAENLYEIHLSSGSWQTTFIATLAGADSPEWETNRIADTAFLTARASPSGRYFAFMSAGQPTGYDNTDAVSGAADEEVYLYDSTRDALTCVSCNPTGARPFGVLDHTQAGEGVGLLVDRRKIWAELGREHWLAGNIPGWTAQSLTTALFQSRYLNDQGRLFFNSPDELVPAATSHKENVYEYEPGGTGSCASSTGGCVSLLSSGSSDHESAFIEASPSGSNVFFVTADTLLPQDTDTAFDIYDARECSSTSPCLDEPSAPAQPCLEVATCRPANPPISTVDSGGTANYVGPADSPAPATGVLGAKTTAAPVHALNRKQQLANALRACRRRHHHAKRRRQRCEAQARKRHPVKQGKQPRTPPQDRRAVR